MASTIQIPAEGRAVGSAGEHKSAKASQETSQPKSNAVAEADFEAVAQQYSPQHHEIAQLAY